MNLKFGTDGIRGPVETHITPEACLKIGHATGLVMKEQGWDTVMIGKDTRVSGYMLESALQAGFIAAGVNVSLCGPLPTPGVAYLTKSLRKKFGVVISASHNNFSDNGIKIFNANGEKLSRDLEKKIEKLLESDLNPVKTEKLGKAKRFDESGARYIEFCKSTVPQDISFASLRIVLDCANGACYKTSPDVFKELGAEVISIGVDPDGYNINADCGSTHPEIVQKEVIKHRADFGISLDGDGDRVIIIDRNGNILDGDDLLYILAFANPNRIGPWSGVVGTHMSNLGFEDGITKLGYKFIRADVGDRYVKEVMQKNKFNLGGEQSGHIILGKFATTGDGLLVALESLFALRKGKKASEFFENFNKTPQLLKNIEVKDKNIINKPEIKKAIKLASKLIRGSGRILVRKSGTESKIRIMGESENKRLLVKCVNIILKKIR